MEELQRTHAELQERMADPAVSGNNAEYQKVARAVADIQVGPPAAPGEGGAPPRGSRPVRDHRPRQRGAGRCLCTDAAAAAAAAARPAQDAVDAFAAYREAERQLAAAREMLRESDGDPDMAELAREEIETLQQASGRRRRHWACAHY